jgi:phosphocarrier protein HPr
MSEPPPATDDCPPEDPVPDGTLTRELTIVNNRGLHARAAARLVQTVERFEAEVKVTRCGETVGGTSIMGILMLAAPPGGSVRFTARGKEAAAVLDALEQLLADKFGEEE